MAPGMSRFRGFFSFIGYSDRTSDEPYMTYRARQVKCEVERYLETLRSSVGDIDSIQVESGDAE